MKSFVIASTLLIGIALVSADETKKDVNSMQGDWACEKMVRDGMPIPDDAAQALFRTVKGDSYTVYRFRTKVSAGTMKLDPSKSPKHLDLFPEGGKGAKIEGIYKLEGDILTMCYGTPKHKRPTEFSAKEKSGLTLITWIREKK